MSNHEVFVNDEGIVPTCDICDGPQFVEGEDWNGETGNHHSCESKDEEFARYAWMGSPQARAARESQAMTREGIGSTRTGDLDQNEMASIQRRLK